MIIITNSHTENGSINGDVLVQDGGDLQLYGIINGTLTVGRGGYASINGMVDQLVLVDGGGARLDGMCNGSVHNRGGELVIAGTVCGHLSGHAEIEQGARIAG